jgi:hypothetical protein
LNPADFEAAYRDAVTLQPDRWREVLEFCFGSDYAEQRKPKKGKKKKDDEESKTSDVDEPEEESKRPQIKVIDEIKSKKFENIGIWVENNMYFKNFKRIKM